MKFEAPVSFLRVAVGAISLTLAVHNAFAQTSGGTGQGLDHLDEQQVMANLASSNLETLLNRDFKNFNIPENERAQTRTFLALRELTGSNLNVADRRAKAMVVAKGFDGLLPKATDPDVLFNQANQLFSSGIIPTVAELEYFGENPTAQSQLQPVAETAKRMYVQVGVLADRKLNALIAQINNNNFQKISPQLQPIKLVKVYGIFSDNMATYSLCIALPMDDPKRKSLSDATIKYLQDFNNPQAGIQSTVVLQIGKLQLVQGDFSAAKTTLDSIVAGSNITPPPTIADQNNARYFGVVALISSRKLNDAEKAIPDLDNWEIQNFLPTLKNPSDQAAVKAALSMLKFRLYSAQSDLTNDTDAKKQKNDAAIDVLAQLLKSQPSLKDLVFDQLIGRIPEQPDYASLNPLILQALQQQGFVEVVKPESSSLDQKKMTRAIDAARELIRRNGQPGVDATAAGLSAYFIPYAFERLHNEKESAAAFMDFAEKFPNDKVKSADALDHATAAIGKLRKADPEDQDTRKLYDRFLPLAINPPYNRKQFAFGYAALLQGESKFKEAVTYFQQVPKTDKKYADAQYLELLSLYKQLSDTALAGADRQAVVDQILGLTRNIDGLLSTATTPEAKAKYVEWVVNAELISANLTIHEKNDPNTALQILNGFEARVAGAKDAGKAHLDALQLRISADMGAGKTDDAVKALVALLEVNPVQGQGLMFDVLKTVEHEQNIAADPAEKKKLAGAKAILSGFVVDWAAKSQDTKVQAALPNYQLYDADAKREAAELNDDTTARTAGLETALKEYQALHDRTKDSTSLQGISDAAIQGIGLAQFDLGNYQQAMDSLGSLVTGNKIGQPMMPVGAGGAEQMVENPQFWEANYKDLRSIVEVYKKNRTAVDARKNLEAARQYIGVLYINNGKNTGGKTYHDEFEKLKAEIAGLQGGEKQSK